MKKRIIDIILALVLCVALAVPAFAAPPDAPSAWALEQVNEAIALGIVPPSLQSRYAEPITRAEFCALAVALIEHEWEGELTARKQFADTDDVNVEKAAAVRIVNGVSEDMFEPDTGLTREQAAHILYMLSYDLNRPLEWDKSVFSDSADISYWAVVAIGHMRGSEIMNGVGGNTFDPKGAYTIEQSIVSILRVYHTPLREPIFNDTYEDWLRGCTAIQAVRIGLIPNNSLMGGLFVRSEKNMEIQINGLARSWGIESREDLIETIERMTDDGHNDAFARDYEMVSSLTDAEYEELLEGSSGMDKYMWKLTKNLGDKWGDKQIKAWDWYRMIYLAGCGYAAGYLEIGEQYECMKPVVERLKETFSSWEEATDNYLDGYAWWSRTDVSNIAGTEYERRLEAYEKIKGNKAIYNPGVWE